MTAKRVRGTLRQAGDKVVLKDGAADETTIVKGANAGTATFTLPNQTGTKTLLSADSAAVVTEKDIDGGVASNTRRLTLPRDSKANLLGLTRKEGTIVYATDEDRMYADDGSTLQPLSGPAAPSSPGSPQAVTAGGGVALSVAGAYDQVIWIEGSGGPVDVIASPQVAAGSFRGQRLTLIGSHATNYVRLEHGTGLSIRGYIDIDNTQALVLVWDGSVWFELSRRS